MRIHYRSFLKFHEYFILSRRAHVFLKLRTGLLLISLLQSLFSIPVLTLVAFVDCGEKNMRAQAFVFQKGRMEKGGGGGGIGRWGKGGGGWAVTVCGLKSRDLIFFSVSRVWNFYG